MTARSSTGSTGTGLRLSEWASVLLLELPADDVARTYYTCRLSAVCAKGGRGRRFWMPRSVLADVLAYEEGERARAVRRAQRACRYERLPGLLLVERKTRNRRLEMRDTGGRQVAASLDSLDPGARNRLFRRTAAGRGSSRPSPRTSPQPSTNTSHSASAAAAAAWAGIFPHRGARRAR